MGQGCIWEEREVMVHVEFNKIVMFMKSNSFSPNMHWGFPASVRVLVFGCCLSAASHPLLPVLWGRTGTKGENNCVCHCEVDTQPFKWCFSLPLLMALQKASSKLSSSGAIYHLPAPELVLEMWHLQGLQPALPPQGRHWQIRVPASTRPSLSRQGLAAEL